MAELTKPPCRVLIVEDEAITAMMIEDLVQDAGCEVVGPAGRLGEARELAAVERLDGAVLDVNLNGQAVYPVADQLAARDVPFIFLTGYGSQGLPPSHAHRPVLEKPFRPQDLVRLLTQELGLRIGSGSGETGNRRQEDRGARAESVGETESR